MIFLTVVNLGINLSHAKARQRVGETLAPTRVPRVGASVVGSADLKRLLSKDAKNVSFVLVKNLNSIACSLFTIYTPTCIYHLIDPFLGM